MRLDNKMWIKCLKVREGKNVTEGKEYLVEEIHYSYSGNEKLYRFHDDISAYRDVPLDGFKFLFKIIDEKDEVISKFTTSKTEGLYSLQDIENVLLKHEFDLKDLEEVLKEFKKLIIKNEEVETKEEKQLELEYEQHHIEEQRDDSLPF